AAVAWCFKSAQLTAYLLVALVLVMGQEIYRAWGEKKKKREEGEAIRKITAAVERELHGHRQLHD
ncbi:MAG TPA: hypothetical protein VGL72_24760, partial [Bryobacteraceae bacterium]